MTSYNGPKTEAIALVSFVKLVRCAESVSADVHRHLSTHGLTISQFGILEALYHLGPLCQKDLAHRIVKTAGNITTVISNLEKQGLVSRVRANQDRRYYSVTLTAEGHKCMEQLFPVHRDIIIKRMAKLTPDEQIQLGNLCKKLALYN